MPKQYTADAIYAEASKLIETIWKQGSDPYVAVTDKVFFRMKNLIKEMRKNYWGIYNEPKDPTTGRNKIWIPLTESTVEGVVKNIDLDTKDINFRAKNPSSIGLTHIIRSATKNELDEMGFGQLLDISERQMAIDGTLIWKTWEEKDDDGYCTKVKLVDPLNFAIDPTAECIQDSDVVERLLVTEQEFKDYKFPLNTAEIKPTNTPDKFGFNQDYQTGANYIELYEYWGAIPKYFITLKEEDKEQIQGRIVASAKSGSGYTIHLIEKMKGKYSPYEECWYHKIHGRWYGKGIAEKVAMLQVWLNTIMNIRINRSYVAQLGLFKIKKGVGITPQMVSRLASNGAIQVNNMDDIQQLVVQEASQASYKDEEVINNWTERVTNAFSIITGEQLPSTTPATNAVISNRNAQSGFTMVKEGLGMFLERWLNRHVLPTVVKDMTKGKMLRITGDLKYLTEFDESIVNTLAFKELEKFNKSGKLVDERQFENELNKLKDKFKKLGDERYVKLADNFDMSEYDVKVFVTNEEFDKGVAIQNSLTALQLAPEFKDDIIRNVFDLMGMQPPQKQQTDLMSMMGQMQGQNQGQQSGGVQIPQQNPMTQTQEANTL